MIDEKYLHKLLDKFDFDIEICYSNDEDKFHYILKQRISYFNNLDELVDWVITEFEEK